MKIISVGEASFSGVSTLIRSAESEGTVVVTRNNDKVCLLLPLTTRGLRMLRQELRSGSVIKDTPEIQTLIELLRDETI